MASPHISPEQLLQHQDWLFRLVRKLVKDDFTADDMVQATMLEALADERAGESNLPGWLSSTARRLTAQYWRSSFRRKEREEKVAIDDEAVLNQSSEVTELFNIANGALADLPEQERVVIMLRHMQGWKPDAIAEALDVPLDTVYRHAEHGCHKLRGRLEQSYGQDWRANCLGILALPSLQKSVPWAALATGIAASLAVVAASVWGFSKMNSNTESVIPKDDLAVLASEVVTEDLPLEASGFMSPMRFAVSPPTTVSRDIQMQMFTPDGAPYPEGSVRLTWLGSHLAGPPFGITDSEGRITLSAPRDTARLMVHFGGHNLFGKDTALPDDDLEETIPLRLVKGTLPVSFQSSSSEEGQTIEIYGGPAGLNYRGWTGFRDTNAQGIAEALLPEDGEYKAENLNAGAAASSSVFYVEAGGVPFPIPVTFKVATEYNLVVTDKDSGQLLDHAQFFQTATNQGTKHGDYQEIVSEFAGNRGRLSIRAAELFDPINYILVHADGYDNTFIQIKEPLTEEVQVELSAMEWVDARLLSDDSEIEFSSLVIYETIDAYTYPGSSGKAKSKISGPRTRKELLVNPDGSFRLPRVLKQNTVSFKLVATDQFGQDWLSDSLGFADRLGLQLEFEMAPPATGQTVVKIEGANPPSSSVLYRAGFGGAFTAPIVPDENLEMHFATRPGNQISVTYTDKDINFDVRRTLAPEENSAEFLVEIPKGTATLEGHFFGPDGMPLPDGASVSFRYMPDRLAPAEDPRNVNILSAHGRIMDGQVLLKDCPPGEYQYESNSYLGALEQTVRTGVPFVVRYPPTLHFTVQVLDAVDSRPLRAGFQISNQEGLYSPVSYGRASEASGFLHHAFPVDFDQSYLLVTANGHQPQSIAGMLPGQSQQVMLKRGRSLRLNLEDLDFEHQEGHRWNCEAWGHDDDPRQDLIRVANQTIRVSGVPLETVRLLELDENGVETGVMILIDSDGEAELIG